MQQKNIVFLKNLGSWQKFFTTAGRDSRDKSQIQDDHEHVQDDHEEVQDDHEDVQDDHEDVQYDHEDIQDDPGGGGNGDQYEHDEHFQVAKPSIWQNLILGYWRR